KVVYSSQRGSRDIGHIGSDGSAAADAGLRPELVSSLGHVPAGARTPRVWPPVSGILDPGSDALVGHRLVIEARDDMQVRVEPVIVPAERVAVRGEPLVQLGPDEKQKVPRCCPLLGGQVEQGSPVNFGDEGAGAWHDVGRITGLPPR